MELTLSDDAKGRLGAALNAAIERYEERDGAGLAAAALALWDTVCVEIGKVIDIDEFNDAYAGFIGDISLASDVFALCSTIPRDRQVDGEPLARIIAIARDLPRAVAAGDVDTLARYVNALDALGEAFAVQIGVDPERAMPVMLLISGNDPGRDDYELQETFARHYQFLRSLRPRGEEIEA